MNERDGNKAHRDDRYGFDLRILENDQLYDRCWITGKDPIESLVIKSQRSE